MMVKDQSYDEAYYDAAQTVDPIERTAKLKALALVYLDKAYSIGCSEYYNLLCYWPWVENYYGELDAGYYNAMPMISSLWINQATKKKMGY